MKYKKIAKRLAAQLDEAEAYMREQDKVLESAANRLRSAGQALALMQIAFNERCATIAELNKQLEEQKPKLH